MRHIQELIALAKAAHPNDRFFANIDQTLIAFSEVRAEYRAYERALSFLDPESWAELRAKGIAHFADHRNGQLKQGFFNQLNEAFAYLYLVRRGYRQVRVLREDSKTQPDIEYMDGDERMFCEVKTIGISEEQIARRNTSQRFHSSIYDELSAGFVNKLKSTLDVAHSQINARGAKGLIYVLVIFDDFTLANYDTYRKQICTCIQTHTAENVYVKVGLLGQRYIRKNPTSTARSMGLRKSCAFSPPLISNVSQVGWAAPTTR